MLAETVAPMGDDIVWKWRGAVEDSATSPLYIYGSNRLLGWSILAPELSGDSLCNSHQKSVSKRVLFGAGRAGIHNFLGNIHLAGPHVVRNCGVQGE